jgi:hypothetical protein
MTHKTSAPFVDTGDMQTFEETKCHSYVACDVTNAYSSPNHVMNGNTPKVDEVTRQFVYLPPDVLVVFDRIDALDATYEKRFLLQTPPNPKVGGQYYSATNGSSTLYAQTLLPAGGLAATRTNFFVEYGNHPPTTAGNESFGTRLEVIAPIGNKRDYFLHVIGASTQPVSSVDGEDDTSVTVSISTASQGQYKVTFAKTGALAGTLVSMDANQNVTCDEVLGQNGQSPDAGAPDASTTDDGGPTCGTPCPTGGIGGCSCDVLAERTASGANLALLAALAGIVRRRRHA